MNRKHYNYYQTHESRVHSGQNNMITYTFNKVERTIFGLMEERNNLIFLYEYRGNYIGTEFLISFSADSCSYKLVSISEPTKS
jgi:hypothetical protein